MVCIRVVPALAMALAVGLTSAVSGCTSAPLPSAGTQSRAPGESLDGTYRIDTKFSQGTFQGQAFAGGTDQSRWYAFRSTCTPAGCTASATQLDNEDHSIAKPNGVTTTLRLVNGTWHTIKPIDGTVACRSNPQQRLEISTSWSFRFHQDGTLAGAKYYTEVKGGGGDCAGTGTTAKYPMALVREGAAPAGVEVADPPPA